MSDIKILKVSCNRYNFFIDTNGKDCYFLLLMSLIKNNELIKVPLISFIGNKNEKYTKILKNDLIYEEIVFLNNLNDFSEYPNNLFLYEYDKEIFNNIICDLQKYELDILDKNIGLMCSFYEENFFNIINNVIECSNNLCNSNLQCEIEKKNNTISLNMIFDDFLISYSK